MEFIDRYRNIEAGIKLLEILEISGDNPHIQNLQSACRKELKEFLQNVDVDWFIEFVIQARRKMITKKQ